MNIREFFCVEHTIIQDFINKTEYSGKTLHIIKENEFNKYEDSQLIVTEAYAASHQKELNEWKGLIILM